MENLVEQSLIFQEAKKKKIVITEEAINQELVRVEELVKAQGLSLEDALAFRGQSKEDLKQQIRFQKTVESLLAGRVSISDNEIKEFFEKNKTIYGKGATLDKVKDQVKNQLLQTKLAEEYKKWTEDLKAKARIIYFLKF